MSEDVVQFNAFSDVNNQRYLLDFLNGIDLENSLEVLAVSINNDTVDKQAYAQYLYDQLTDGIDMLCENVAITDGRHWRALVNDLKQQQKEEHLTVRIAIALKYPDTEDGQPDVDLHELVTMWSPKTNSYLLVGYNYNHDSIVHILTDGFLEPIEPMEETPAVHLVKC